ncbi:MAG: TIGR00730 family Rossman fold protein [Balneolaceae bacterium]
MSNSICIYCGSRIPKDVSLQKLATDIGVAFATEKWNLVYGGGKIGMMGLAADAALKAGGKVTGVIPTALKRVEVAHTGLTHLYETPDMHTRKAMMERLSDAFVVLPGGFGTLDEFFEILTWRQLGFHQKPIVLINSAGYFDGLVHYVEKALSEDFIRKDNLQLFTVANTLDETLTILKTHFK